MAGKLGAKKGIHRPPSSCIVPGCNKPMLAKQYCNGHYVRFKKYGDVFPERPLCRVTFGKLNPRWKGGKLAGIHTPTYDSWSSMKKRCLNPKSKDYRYYGDRGIVICERWMDFKNFLKDMGEKPTGLTLERKNNDLGYFPENCMWATRKEQSQNRRNVKCRRY